MSNFTRCVVWATGRLLPCLFIMLLLSAILSPLPAFSQALSLIQVSDEELDAIHASGLYFRMDLSLEVSTLSDTPPQVILNAGTPLIIPTTGTTGGTSGPGGSITLADNAQSQLNSLVNVIGAASVINVGVNIVNITNSTNDTIYTTNINTGAQGSGLNIVLPLPLLP